MLHMANEISIEEAAARAQVSRASIDRWLAAGKLRGVRRGSRVFVDATDLARLLVGTPMLPDERQEHRKARQEQA